MIHTPEIIIFGGSGQILCVRSFTFIVDDECFKVLLALSNDFFGNI